MAGDLTRIPFRSTAAQSLTEFAQFREAAGPLLARRRASEAALTKRTGPLDFEGVCALCTRLVRFRVDMPQDAADESQALAWPDRVRCECGLTSRERALIHAAVMIGRMERGSPIRAAGPQTAVTRWLEPRFPNLHSEESNVAVGSSLDVVLAVGPVGSPEEAEGLAREAASRLRSRGSLLFTARRPDLLSEGDAAEVVGWAAVERVRQAGLPEVHVHHYWSEELGYLGPDNFIFVARKA